MTKAQTSTTSPLPGNRDGWLCLMDSAASQLSPTSRGHSAPAQDSSRPCGMKWQRSSKWCWLWEWSNQTMLPSESPTWSLLGKSLGEYEFVWTCALSKRLLFPTNTLYPQLRSWPPTSMGWRSLLSWTCTKVTCRCHFILPAETSKRLSHTRMSFGLSSAPSCFQKLLRKSFFPQSS